MESGTSNLVQSKRMLSSRHCQEKSIRNIMKMSLEIEEMDECLFYDDLFEGKDDVVKETDEFVSAKLIEIEREIDKLLSNSGSDELKEAYYMALVQEIKQKTNYVRSKKLLLAFLRRYFFDARKAAKGLAEFFKCKLDLFGPDKLPYRVTDDDLNEDDRKILYSGGVDIDSVDCAGRSVILLQRSRLSEFGLFHDRYRKSFARIWFYLNMRVIEDNVHCQKHGCILIRWNLNGTQSQSLKHYIMFFRPLIHMSVNAIPIRFAAVHDCIGNTIASSCLAWSVSLFRSTSRLKLHKTASPEECFSELSKYGINIESLPIISSSDCKQHQDQPTEICSSNKEKNMFAQEKLNCNSSKDDTYEMEHINDCFKSCSSKFRLHNSEQEFQVCPRNMHEETPALIENCANKSEVVPPSPVVPSSKVPASKGNIHNTGKTKPKQLVEQQLPYRIMEILEGCRFPHSIWWSQNGTSFVIHKDNFCKILLPKIFAGIKLNSFLRKLRRCGFRRVLHKGGNPHNLLEYQHQLFQRNARHLLEDWTTNDEDKGKKKDKLPVKLKKILDDSKNYPKIKAAIWWINDGQAFAINIMKFQSSILNDHFIGVRMDSFYRMLNKWGFKRLHDEEKCSFPSINNSNKNCGAIRIYHHALFQKHLELIPEQWNNCTNLDEIATQTMATTSTRENFLKKISRIINSDNKKFQNAIWWCDEHCKDDDDNGINRGVDSHSIHKAIAIHSENFTCDVIPEEFDGVAFVSFRRNLSRWGFEKLHNHGKIWVYKHPSFQNEILEDVGVKMPNKKSVLFASNNCNKGNNCKRHNEIQQCITATSVEKNNIAHNGDDSTMSNTASLDNNHDEIMTGATAWNLDVKKSNISGDRNGFDNLDNQDIDIGSPLILQNLHLPRKDAHIPDDILHEEADPSSWQQRPCMNHSLAQDFNKGLSVNHLHKLNIPVPLSSSDFLPDNHHIVTKYTAHIPALPLQGPGVDSSSSKTQDNEQNQRALCLGSYLEMPPACSNCFE